MSNIRIYWLNEKLHHDVNFIFSDQAHFVGYIKKQNCYIWSWENQQIVLQKLMHPYEWSLAERMPHWPIFLWKWGRCNLYGQWKHLSHHGNRFFYPLFMVDVNDVWFQQDGETCHASHAIIDLLRQTFDDRLISPNGDVNWPPRNCV